MNSNNEAKNTSLSSLAHHEPSRSDNAPVRNAVSTIKRPTENTRRFKVNLKAVRLKDLTQEMLEAQNEPLGVLVETETEENAENDRNDLNKVHTCKTENQNALKPQNKCKYENVDLDLGVSWLETPVKSDPNTKYTNNIYDRTPKTNYSTLFATPLDPRKKKEYVTPTSVVKSAKDDKCTTRPKVQCSIDIRPVLKTPVNKFAFAHSDPINHSLKKHSSQKPPFKKSESAVSARSINIKSSTQSADSILQQQNKDNKMVQILEPKVQFSQPIVGPDFVFKNIVVKNVTYVVLKELGRGGSSVVYYCYDSNTKNERAIKKVNLSSDTNAVGYVNEVQVLSKLQKCNRIIKMYDYELNESDQTLWVVLEKGGSDLSKILKDLLCTNEHLPMYMLIFYWMEMLYAVKQIHENGIIHSDLKPANFLRVNEGLKLIDFGIASCIQNDMTSVARNIPVGSFNYISPEALTNQPTNNCDSPSFGKAKYKVSYKSDVWSLGCILYQLVYRKTPFQHIGHMWAKLSAIMDPKHEIDYPETNWVPSKVVNTIKKCLQYDMKARPSIDDLIQEYKSIYN